MFLCLEDCLRISSSSCDEFRKSLRRNILSCSDPEKSTDDTQIGHTVSLEHPVYSSDECVNLASIYGIFIICEPFSESGYLLLMKISRPVTKGISIQYFIYTSKFRTAHSRRIKKVENLSYNRPKDQKQDEHDHKVNERYTSHLCTVDKSVICPSKADDKEEDREKHMKDNH